MKHQIVDAKASFASKGEADECLFEYLHAEMVNYVLSTSVKTGVRYFSNNIWFNFNYSSSFFTNNN